MGREKTETTNNRPEKPLFSIYLPELSADGKRKPRIGKTVSGYFKQFNHDYVFCPDSQDDDDDEDPFCWTIAPEKQLEMGLITMEEVASIVGRGWKIEPDCGFESLFYNYSEENQRVELIGRQNRKRTSFRVYEIEMPHSGKEPFSAGNRNLLAICCSQLEKHRDCSYEPMEDMHRPRLRRKEEYEAFYRICRHTLPDWVAQAVQRELDYLRNGNISSTNKEHALAALGYLTSIDWNKKDFAIPDLEAAKQKMDSVLYGMDELKERILNIIAAIQISQELPEWGILFYGPPGVGKTELSCLIAEILNRPVVMMTETGQGAIGGSSRIYQNARPGFLVEKMAEVGTSNIVFVIQEIEKIRNTYFEGEAASFTTDELLSVADNKGFSNQFLETIVPSKDILVIATGNDISKLSAPLKDRFQCIMIPDYSATEKEVILKQYIWPQALKHRKLTEDQFVLSEEACRTLVRDYAGSTGLRALKKAAEQLVEKYCRMLVQNGPGYKDSVSAVHVRELLGPGKPQIRKPNKAGEITGIFCTKESAHLILMEASAVSGTGQFRMLGAATRQQRDFIHVAYESVRNTTPIDLTSVDITMFAQLPWEGLLPNSIGCAAVAAICCAVREIEPIEGTAFFGGVGLNGSLYNETEDLRPLARELVNRDIKLLYCPVGIGQKLAQADHTLENLITVEAKDIYDLLSTVIEFQRRY